MLSIIIVNFNAAEYIVGLLASLAAVDWPPGFIQEVLIVDNGSRPDDAALVQTLQGDEITVFAIAETSFAAANNHALARARGDYICFLNPDTLLLDDSLKRMVDLLQAAPDVGAVGPQFWSSSERIFLLPPNEAPSLLGALRTVLSQPRKKLLEWESLRRSRYALRYWRAGEPRDIPMLSGACIVTRRSLLQEIGGFDERFPLYYEDADWCRRVQACGKRLVYMPNAEIVHLYNRSAGQDYQAALSRSRLSERRYFHKYYGRTGSWLLRGLRYLERRLPKPFRTIPSLGAVSASIRLDHLVDQQDVYLELSASPVFSLAAANFSRPARLKFPPESWADRSGQEWYLRFVAQTGNRVIGTYRFYLRPRPSSPDWSFRTLELSDGPAFRALFEEVFETPRSPAEWDWAFQRPGLQLRGVVAFNAAGDMVAAYVAMPTMMRVGGEERVAMQPIDTMIREDYRGRIGRRLLIKEIFNAFTTGFSGSEAGQARLFYGLPNEGAWKIGKRYLGYDRFEDIIYWTQALPSALPLDKELSLETIARYDRRHESLLKQVGSEPAITLIKDRAYLNWRYQDRPNVDYLNLALHRGEKLIGIIILVTDVPGEQHNFPRDRLGLIVDWLLPQLEWEHFDAIMAQVGSAAQQAGITRLMAVFPNQTIGPARLEQAGFKPLQSRYALGLVSFKEQLNADHIAENWYFMPGDFDIV
jgi:hypothetical protein